MLCINHAIRIFYVTRAGSVRERPREEDPWQGGHVLCCAPVSQWVAHCLSFFSTLLLAFLSMLSCPARFTSIEPYRKVTIVVDVNTELPAGLSHKQCNQRHGWTDADVPAHDLCPQKGCNAAEKLRMTEWVWCLIMHSACWIAVVLLVDYWHWCQ